MTHIERAAHPRAGLSTRAVVYPPFTQIGPDERAAGTRGIYLYLRLSKYHRDGADAIERQRLEALHNVGCSWGLNSPVSRSDRAM